MAHYNYSQLSIVKTSYGCTLDSGWELIEESGEKNLSVIFGVIQCKNQTYNQNSETTLFSLCTIFVTKLFIINLHVSRAEKLIDFKVVLKHRKSVPGAQIQIYYVFWCHVSLGKRFEITLVLDLAILSQKCFKIVFVFALIVDGSRSRSAAASYCAQWGNQQGECMWLLALVTCDR